MTLSTLLSQAAHTTGFQKNIFRAILGVRAKGGLDAAKRVLKKVRIFDYMVNVGDAKSMSVHPATSTHYGLQGRSKEKSRSLRRYASYSCWDREYQ